MPLTSVIIATRNRPEFVSRAVHSARSAASDLEIIVVDDASCEETARVCQSLAEVVKYVRVERQQGLGGARNIGIMKSRGDYISFLDDDDLRLEDTLDRQVELLEKHPSAGLIYARANVANADGKTLHAYPDECPQGDVFWQLLSRNFIPCGSVVFRRSCLSQLGMLDDDSPGIEDWDLWIRIAEMHPILALEIPVVVWRKSTPVSGQLTSRAAQIVRTSICQFGRWMHLPRAAEASQQTRRLAWKHFSDNMTGHLLWESARALTHRQLRQFWANLSIIPKLEPLALMRIARKGGLRVTRTRLRESLVSFLV
jgi:glycosyl transferase family 2